MSDGGQPSDAPAIAAAVPAAGPPGWARTLVTAFGLAWRANRAAFAGQLAIAVLAGLAPVVAAWLLRDILDLVVGHRPWASLIAVAVALAVVGGLPAVLTSGTNYLAAQSGRATQRQTITGLFTVVSRLAGLRRLEDPGFHDRLNVAQQAGSFAPGQVLANAIAIGQAALTLTGFLVTLALLSPLITVVVLLAAIPGIWSELILSRRRAAMIMGVSHAQRRQYFYQNLLTELAAAKEIRLFGLGDFFAGRLLAELRSIHRAGQRLDRRDLALHAGLAALGALVAAGGLLWAVYQASHGRLTVGDVTMFVVAMGSVATSLGLIVASVAMAYQALLTFAPYLEITAGGPDLPRPARPRPAPALRHGITLDDVWFRYGPGQPWALRGVTMFIPRGQAVALVGRNGAGKSTLVKLICRFYDPDRGAILWDGVDLRDLELAGLRDRISAVFQDFMTYELSAADNIAVGDLTQASDAAALTAAARRAGIHQALAALPKGYDTLLTRTYLDPADRDDPQAGVLLSGGQWQRVGLARALLRSRRDLVILDEPSSGLDAEAEHEIHASLMASRQHNATVLISHRLNTVRDADHIVVLADGSVSEQGTHDELMTRSGIYARLFTLQARGYAAPGPRLASKADPAR